MIEDFNDEFLESLIPLDYSYRDDQKSIVKDVLEAFQSYDYVCLNSPVGTGKTYVYMSVMNAFNDGTVLTTSNELQAQIHRDFPYTKVFSGKGRYGCLHGTNETCEECELNKDKKCTDCDYEIAKYEFQMKYKVGLANYWSYFFLNRREPVNKDLLVMDEVQNLENVLLDFYTLNIPLELLKGTDISLLDSKDSGFELLDINDVDPNLDIIMDNVKKLVEINRDLKNRGKHNKFKTYMNKQFQMDSYKFDKSFVYKTRDNLVFSITDPENYVQSALLDSHKYGLFTSATVDKEFIRRVLDGGEKDE